MVSRWSWKIPLRNRICRLYFLVVVHATLATLVVSQSDSLTPTLSDSASLTASVTPVLSASESNTVTSSVSASVTPSLSSTGSATDTGTISDSVSQSVSSSASDTHSRSASQSESARASATTSSTTSTTRSASLTGSESPSESVLPSTSIPLSASASRSLSPSESFSEPSSGSGSTTGSESPSESQSDSASESPSPSASASNSVSVSETATESASSSGTASASGTPSASGTASSSGSSSQSESRSKTATVSISTTPPAAGTESITSSTTANPSVSSLSTSTSETSGVSTTASTSVSATTSRSLAASTTTSLSVSTSRSRSATASPSQLAFMSPSPTASPSPRCHPACANAACSSFGGGPETCLGECSPGYVVSSSGGCTAAHNATMTLVLSSSSLTSCDAFDIRTLTLGSTLSLAVAVADGLDLEPTRVLFLGIECRSSAASLLRTLRRRQLDGAANVAVLARLSVTNLRASDVPVLQSKVPLLTAYMPPVVLGGIVYAVTNSSVSDVTSVCDPSCSTCIDSTADSCITCASELELLAGSPGRCGEIRYVKVAVTDSTARHPLGSVGIVVVAVLAVTVFGLVALVILLLWRCWQSREITGDCGNHVTTGRSHGKKPSDGSNVDASLSADSILDPDQPIGLVVDGDQSQSSGRHASTDHNVAGHFDATHRKPPILRTTAHLATMMRDLNPGSDASDHDGSDAFEPRMLSGSSVSQRNRESLGGSVAHENEENAAAPHGDSHSPRPGPRSGSLSPHVTSTSRLSPKRLGARRPSKRSESQLRRYHAAASTNSVASSRPSTPVILHRENNMSRSSSDHSLVLPINALAEAVLHEAKHRMKKHHSSGGGKKRRSRSKAR